MSENSSSIISGEDTKNLPLAPNSIETIDGAFFDYVQVLRESTIASGLKYDVVLS